MFNHVLLTFNWAVVYVFGSMRRAPMPHFASGPLEASLIAIPLLPHSVGMGAYTVREMYSHATLWISWEPEINAGELDGVWMRKP